MAVADIRPADLLLILKKRALSNRDEYCQGTLTEVEGSVLLTSLH